MASETMYDSTTPAAIPKTATLILTYIDGIYKTDAAVAQQFPTARRETTTITAYGDLNAKIYDCERGNGDATQAAAWALRVIRQTGRRPTIYCSRIGSPGYGWSWVVTALEALGIKPAQVDFGIADYTGQPHLVPGSAFTQYANPTYTGANYDLSLTNGVWPNDPPAGMLNAPASGIVASSSGKGYAIVAEDGGVFCFGDFPFHGSLPEYKIQPAKPIVGMAAPPNEPYYWLVGADGGVFALPPGVAPFYGAANS